AICPRCKILLVEADSTSFVALGTAVNYAASQSDVVAISNSYGASEFSSETSYDSYYNHPGKAITVSSGDGGYGVEYPAASPFVASVYALSGNASTLSNSFPYGQPAQFYDVTGGTNGSCGGTYLCAGVVGYDGPTGLGTPNGTGGF